MKVYDYIVVESTTDKVATFVPTWEHTQEELRVLCVLVDKDAYSWAVVDAGKLTKINEERYSLACPFEYVEGEEPKSWKTFVWRKTDSTEDVSFDGTRVPVEAIVAKLIELTRKTDENAKECGRALRTPEGDSDAFFPTKDIRAGEIAGFDDDGKPAVGNNIRGIKVITDAATRAEGAAETAESAAYRAEKAASSVEWVEDKVAEYTNNAEAAAERARGYANTAVTSATEAKESAYSAAEDAENTAEYYAQVDASVKALLAAIERAKEEGIIIDVPIATSMVAGKVKLGTDTVVADENIGGVVGLTSEGRMAIPKATKSNYGGILLGDWYNNGELVSATASVRGVVKLGTDTVLSATSDVYDTFGSVIGVNSDGQLLGVSATLTRLGSVKLGSEFQPTNSMPYVVGIGASTNEKALGQIAFNLNMKQSDGSSGALIYEIISNTPACTYAMKVREATSKQMGVVYMEGDGNTAVSKRYVDAKFSSLDSTVTKLGVRVDDIEEIVSSTAALRLLSYVDSDGNEISQFDISPEETSVSIPIKWWLIPNHPEDITATVTDVPSSYGTIDVLTTGKEMVENGSVELSINLSESAYDKAIPCYLKIFYAGSTSKLTINKLGAVSVSIDDAVAENESGNAF